ncbi:MAG: hypothetical protein H5T64_02525 [Chloroflexi bacterium]|nr:hypothetical protein [Chloroflexota bacterium]
MLDSVAELLNEQRGVDDWLAREIEKTSTQVYIIGERPESRRTVFNHLVQVKVFNDHVAPDTGDRSRGSAVFTVLSSDKDNVPTKIADAVSIARLTHNQPYGLPGPAMYPEVPIVDEDICHAPLDVAERLTEQLHRALRDEKGVRLSSAEIFVQSSHLHLRNSRGIDAVMDSTSLLLDLVLLARRDNGEMESHVALERRRSADLDISALVHRYAQYARDSLEAILPATGRYPVVVSHEALAELLFGEGSSPLVFRTAAEQKYQKVSPLEVGESIFGTIQPTGDPITFYSNAVLPYGMRSCRFDEEGLPGQRVIIVESGTLRHFWAPQRYAEYLGVSPTGIFGNLEMVGGTTPMADLLHSDGRMYHLVGFSAMNPDPITGDFVGEIRLGYEINGNRKRAIKGGSVSGNLFDALATARLSEESVFLGNYQGPVAVLFPSLTISGA